MGPGVLRGHNAFFDQAALPEANRVMISLVALNLFGRAVLVCIGICYRVTIITVGLDLQKAWPVFLAGPLTILVRRSKMSRLSI